MNRTKIRSWLIELRLIFIKLLSISPEGITYDDLREFTKFIFAANHNYDLNIILEGVSRPALLDIVEDYNNQFREFDGTYYSSPSFNPRYFESGYSDEENQLLDRALNDYAQARILKMNSNNNL